MDTTQTIQTINLSLPKIPTEQSLNKSQPLMSDEDIDQLIEAQRIKKLQDEKLSTPPIQINTQPPQNSNPTQQDENEDQDEKSKELSFNIDRMNVNLDNIIVATHSRISDLKKNQVKVQQRIDLLEKFIRLDEKELALEIQKHEPNTQKVIGIRKSIVHQTELFDQTMDILLKFEGSIHTWTKTLMDVEKDKVSAYHKIKSINKEQATADTDITDILGNLNAIIKSDPTKVQSILGGGTLNISGYSGKKFQQS